jgi:hypothetical protein
LVVVLSGHTLVKRLPENRKASSTSSESDKNMARTLTFFGTLQWPLEDGQQAAKAVLSTSLVYTSAMAIEKLYSSAVTDEVIALPMASAKFLLLQATGNDIDVKLNGNANAITIKASTGFILVWNSDGAITGVTITVATVPATLKGYAFA